MNPMRVTRVSILVLLDYGALSSVRSFPVRFKACFNPCFVGLWGFEWIMEAMGEDKQAVSILVLLDYGALSQGARSAKCANIVFQSLFCWIMGL